MGLLDRFFKNHNPTDNVGHKIQMVTERGNGFYAWNGKLYKSDIIRSLIRPKIRAMGKLVAKHVRNSPEGLKVNPEAYMRFLLEEPNPYMTGQIFQEKMAAQLMLNGNAFALVVRDDFGYPMQLYPIHCTSAEVIYSENGDINLKFTLPNSKRLTFPYTDIIHLRRDFYGNDIFGDSPIDVLEPVMEIINTIDQGIVKAIQNSNVIQWLLKFTSATRPDDIKASVKEFVDSFLAMSSKSSVAAGVDSKFDAIQVEPKSYVPNAQQMDRQTVRLYNFFNTNEKIVQSSADENQWTAYYESEIEPDAMQCSSEYTRKLFSRKERGFGNKITFDGSNLAHASMQTKLALVQFVDRGMMTPNEVREIFNMVPIESGDIPLRRLDTVQIKEGGAE